MFKALFGKTQKSASAQSRFETRKNLKLESLRNWDEISALCGSSFKPDEFKAPKVDMSEAGNGVELAIALPGIAGQDVDIKLDGAMLTLKAQGAHDLSVQGESASWVANSRALTSTESSFRSKATARAPRRRSRAMAHSGSLCRALAARRRPQRGSKSARLKTRQDSMAR